MTLLRKGVLASSYVAPASSLPEPLLNWTHLNSPTTYTVPANGLYIVALCEIAASGWRYLIDHENPRMYIAAGAASTPPGYTTAQYKAWSWFWNDADYEVCLIGQRYNRSEPFGSEYKGAARLFASDPSESIQDIITDMATEVGIL